MLNVHTDGLDGEWGVSVIFREVTGCGAEVFPVVRVDSTVGSHAHGTSSTLGDILLVTGIGVDYDELPFPLVLANEDFDPRGNPVVVDDVVHTSMVLRKWQGVNPLGCDSQEIPEKT